MVEKLRIITQGPSIIKDVGFVPGNPNNFVALGTPEDITNILKTQGWSEEAIAAFFSGKYITRKEYDTPFGRVGHDENWKDKGNA